jgi:sulfatase modifying factor 1
MPGSSISRSFLHPLFRITIAVLAVTTFAFPAAAKAAPADSSLTETTNTIGIEMIRIPSGTFMMGSPANESGRSDHERQHKVTLSRGFWLGKTEVTQRQWKAVMGENPSKIIGEDRPVERVSWHDCLEFCNALSRLEGLTPAYLISEAGVTWNESADGYRLPTEAEWEYACRAGTTGPFAGDLDEMAIYSRNSGRKTSAVGIRRANSWGFHDMHGNVAEWCWDAYEKDYGAGWVMDPIGPDEGEFRVQRGGNWHFNAMGCRSASRGADKSDTLRNRLGIRLSRP